MPNPEFNLALDPRASTRQSDMAFAGLLAISVALFWAPLRSIAVLSWSDDKYTHLLLIPAISAFLFYLERERIFSQPRERTGIGFWFLGGAIGIFAISRLASEDLRLSVTILSVLLAWISIFAFCYGLNSTRAAAFPLGFMAFMIPLPESAANWIVHALQSASADVSAVLFHAIGMPSFRTGFRFLLPGVQIEVARECSGIRSTFALILVSVLAGYVLLRSPARRLCLALTAIPIGIFKNAVRIVALSYLGVYVDRAYLTGKLHHEYGGLVFSSLSLLLVIPILLLLRKSEATSNPANEPRPQEAVS